MNKLIACAVVALFAYPFSARAVQIAYGTAELVSIRNCNSGATSACDTTSSPSFVFGGMPGDTFSQAFINQATKGSASGYVSLSWPYGEPIIGASAISLPGYRASTNSVGLQKYTYIGTAPTTRTWGGTLTYSQTLSAGNYPPVIGNGVHAALDVFTLPGGSNATIDVGSTADSNFNALINVSLLTGYHSLASTEFFDTNSQPPVTSPPIGVTVTLNPNDTIWVWGLLQTPATNGSNVDAFHTFTTAWDNPANLVPAAIAPIPEPATLSLMAVGLAGIGLARRSRRRARV